jgi:nitrogen fixation protein FixH
LVVHDFADADLCDFDTACQAWTGIAVQNSYIADAVSSGFEQSILFSVEAEACG